MKIDSLLRALLGSAAIAATVAISPAAAENGAPKWTPWVELGGRISNDRALGESILFTPLMQSDRSLLFADIRGMFDDNDAREGNFGLGLRHMLPSGWNVGAFGYFDVRRSALGHTFHQGTLGFEALSRDIDVRANAYLPLGDREKRIDLGSTSTTVVGSPGLVLTGTTLAIQTDTVVTTTSGFLAERALAGFDAEIGFRLPVFDIGTGLDLRAYAGGYYFDATDFDKVAGPRGRLELTAHDLGGYDGVRLTAGITFQQDDVRDEQVIGHARLRIPLQRTASTSRDRLTYMERRMMDTVVRDVDIVSNSATTASSSSTTTTSAEEVVNVWNDEVVTSVTFVDGADGQAALQGELDSQASGAVVVLNGALNAPNGILVNSDQTLLGGGTALRVRGAQSGMEIDYIADGAAGSITGQGTRPAGAPFTALVGLSARSVVSGMTLQQIGNSNNTSVVQAYLADGAVAVDNIVIGANGLSAHGMIASFSSDVTFADNVVTSGSGGSSSALGFRDSSSGSIIGNDLTNLTTSAPLIILHGSQVIAANNIIRPHSNGRVVTNFDSTFLSGSTGNEIIGSFLIRCQSSGTHSGTIEFTDNSQCP